METVCRLCAKEKLLKQLTYSIKDYALDIKQKLIDCCRWNVIVEMENEALPKRICTGCYRKLEMSWSFAESVAQAQQQICSMFVEEKSVLPAIEHVEIVSTAIMDEPIKNEQIESIVKSEPNDSESPNESYAPTDMFEVILEQEEDANPRYHHESVANGRPKQKRKPALQKYQADFGNGTATNKGQQQPKKQPNRSRVCDKCGKEFITTDLLKSHLKIHSDERPYPCLKCKKRFRSKKDLEVRNRLIRINGDSKLN